MASPNLSDTVQRTMAALVGFLYTEQAADLTITVSRERFERFVRSHGLTVAAQRLGLKEAEFAEGLAPAIRRVAESERLADSEADHDHRIAALRFLQWTETIGERVSEFPNLPGLPTQAPERVAQKQVRAIELIVRALVNSHYGDQPRLIGRLRNLFNSDVVEQWLKNADRDNVLTGTLFSDLANIFTHKNEFANYSRIYAGNKYLTFLRDHRRTIRDFLDDIRRLRNRIAHHRSLTAVQIELLDAYYDQIVTPIQLAFDRREFPINPDAILDADDKVITAYISSIREDLTSIDARLNEIERSVGEIRAETTGLRLRTKILLGLTVMLLALGSASFWLMGAVKRETSDDARKELANIGVEWSRQKFEDAIRDRDYRAVNLFLRGGMTMESGDKWPLVLGTSYFSLFSGGPILFDSKIADAIIQYNAVNADLSCPTSVSGRPGSPRENFNFYNKDIKVDPIIADFVRKVCNKPSIIAKIDEHISEIQKNKNSNRYKLDDEGNWREQGWEKAKEFLLYGK